MRIKTTFHNYNYGKALTKAGTRSGTGTKAAA